MGYVHQTSIKNTKLNKVIYSDMEWYYGSGGDDLVVPRNQEPLDRLPSPDSWSQWGISESMKKHFNEKSFCNEVDISISGHDREYSSNSSMSHNGSLQWTTLSHEQPDYQLNELARIDQMDDIFMSSVLEEDETSTDYLHGESNYSMMSSDNLDMILDSEYFPTSHTYGMASSKYLKAHAFSPSVEWEKGEVATPLPVKAPVAKFSVPSEHDSVNGCVGDEASLEESVLQELERVTAQLTVNTRTCFRDALYRLAENSKQQTVNLSQNGDLIMEDHSSMMVHDDETLRLGKTEATESKTNAIDRAIANLMFSKMDFSTQNPPTVASLNFKQEPVETERQFKHSFNQLPISCFTIVQGDAEVPIIGQENLSAPANLLRDFRCSEVKMLSSH